MRAFESKYFKKHFEILEPELHEVQCLNNDCGYVFAIDDRWTQYVAIDNDPDFQKIFCPYCGKASCHHV